MSFKLILAPAIALDEDIAAPTAAAEIAEIQIIGIFACLGSIQTRQRALSIPAARTRQ